MTATGLARISNQTQQDSYLEMRLADRTSEQGQLAPSGDSAVELFCAECFSIVPCSPEEG